MWVKHIKASKIFVYISSKAANESEWTRKEIACALMYKKYLIPVLLDDSPFHDSVILRIVDLDRINYYLNPSQGIEKLVSTVNGYLEKERVAAAQKVADEKRKQEALERQRREQEAQKKLQMEIDQLEVDIRAKEARRTELKKSVAQKELELKLVQVDLDACEEDILKLQVKMKAIRETKLNEEPLESIKVQNSQILQPSVADEKVLVIRINDVIQFKMIHVEGGTFTMGATPEQRWEAFGDERPVHQVTLSDYYIGETQVTQALWQAVMDGDNPSRFKGANRPVEMVSWDDCQQFIGKLNELTSKSFRLPTEAEWEFAARGGRNSRDYKYSGSDNPDEVAWFADNSNRETKDVKRKSANELGLYDMSGNVCEWCNDWYEKYTYSPQTHPQGPSCGSRLVVRGGSWRCLARYCRSAYRNFYTPSSRDIILGLRLAL